MEYLPSELMIDILSRLPIRTILNCKCVCKSWFDLIKTDEFINSHHSRSVPRLAVFCESYTSFRFEDGYNLPFSSCYRVHVGGSVNGFLFIRNFPRKRACVLNPITRDCITFDEDFSDKVTYCGFGTSKITDKYKVVKIFHDRSTSHCRVYTLGTGLWRSIEPDAWVYYSFNNDGAFLNGNLHWLVRERDKDGAHWISCFDLENELFTTFSSPPLLPGKDNGYRRVVALEGSLYLCDAVYDYDEIVIWLMMEYGDEKSWSKEFNFRRGYHGLWYGHFYPIRVSKDGDTVMFWLDYHFFSYSKMNNRSVKLQCNGSRRGSDPIVYTPNFLSLTSFANERVTSLFPSQMLPP